MSPCLCVLAPGVAAGARDLGIDTLPEALNDELVQDPNFIDALHHILMDVHVVTGQLQCPESGHVFPITGGVPNMKLAEDLLP